MNRLEIRNSEFGSGSDESPHIGIAHHSRRGRHVAPPDTFARNGLAPLELVLSLFFLLVMMALVINFGSIASWRVRGSIAARYAAWRTIALRTGSNDPSPGNWQVTGAKMGVAPPIPINPNVINQIWDQGDLSQPALRGPAVVDPATGNQISMGNQQYLELTNRALIGTANLTKKVPMLPNLRKSYIQPLHPVVDHFWRFQDMYPGNPPPNVNPNVYWAMRGSGARLYQWYQFEAQQLPDGNLANAFGQFQAAAIAVQQNPNSAALLPLDRDDEFTAAGQIPPPDAYSYASRQGGLNGKCDLDPKTVKLLVEGPNGVLRWIQGPTGGGGKNAVPFWFAQQFINLYKQQIQIYQKQQPPNQQMIDQLQQKIQEKQDFQGTLF